MIDRPASRQQLDLLVRTTNTLESSRIPPPIRAEVTALLKLLMAEHITEGLALPLVAADE